MPYSELFLLVLLAVVASSQPQIPRFQNHPFLFEEPEPTDLHEEQFFYFDIELFQAILDDQPEGNVLISPLSIKTVLAMVLEGSVGETAEELSNALRLTDSRKVPEQFRKLLEVFRSSNGYVDLQMANKIYLGAQYTQKYEYGELIKQYYFSDVEKLSSNNPIENARRINEWVNRATHGTIRELIDEGNARDIKILLANALYFKGKWQKKFSEQGTKIACFRLSNGECQYTPMMDVVDDFKYAEVKALSDAQVVEIPYTGEEYSMIVVLPKDAKRFRQLHRNIRRSIGHLVDGLNKTEVFISLPRFKINYSLDLIRYLPSVNINSMQSDHANIPNIAIDVGTRVSNLLHKTFIDVNEEGTVASAATGAMVIPLMGVSKPRVRADRPFLFFIRHIPTGTILFEGRVMQPEQAANHQQPNQRIPNQTPQRIPNQTPQRIPNQNTRVNIDQQPNESPRQNANPPQTNFNPNQNVPQPPLVNPNGQQNLNGQFNPNDQYNQNVQPSQNIPNVQANRDTVSSFQPNRDTVSQFPQNTDKLLQGGAFLEPSTSPPEIQTTNFERPNFPALSQFSNSHLNKQNAAGAGSISHQTVQENRRRPENANGLSATTAAESNDKIFFVTPTQYS